MNTQTLNQTSLGIAAATFTAQAAVAADRSSLESLLEKMKGKDDKERTEAWQEAAQMGAPAVKGLAPLLEEKDVEVARAGQRALWQIVRYSGRPGARGEAKAVVTQLLPLLESGGAATKREVLWMLSEIAGNAAVPRIAALLSDAELREDARMALERIPGKRSLAALKQGMSEAPEDFKYNIAHSLRVRGEQVDGYPSQKLKPVKQTSVEAKQS